MTSDSPSGGPPIDPGPIFEASVAYWRSAVLFSALELGVFDAIGDDSVSISDLSETLSLPERSLKMLVESLVATELLEVENCGVRNSPRSRAYLCTDRPESLVESIGFNARSVPAWSKLTDAVRSAQPVINTQHFLGDDADATRNFVLAMHHRAQGVARCLVPMLDLSTCQNLLDLGGGPATYSRLLAERFANLHPTVVDLPGVLNVAQELIQSSSAKDRITLKPGDIFAPEMVFEGENYDAILISGVLHRTEGQQTIDFLRNAAGALKPGGMLAISDLFTGTQSHGPVIPELFSLHMMLTANTGQSLPMPQMPEIYAGAGLEFVESKAYPPPLPHMLCIGRKPA